MDECNVYVNKFRYDGLEFGLRGEDATSTERMFADGRAAGFNHVVRGRILAGNYFLLKGNYEAYFEQACNVVKRSLNNTRSLQGDSSARRPGLG